MPKSTKAQLIDATLRHSIFVSRFSGSQLKQMAPYLTRVRNSTAGLLAGKQLTEFNQKRLTRLYNEITGVTAATFEKMGKKLTGNMRKFAAYEKDFQARLLNKATVAEWDVPTTKQIQAAVFSEPVVMLENAGLPIQEALDQFSAIKGEQMVTLVQDGVIAGKTNQEIIQDMSFVTDTAMANGLEALVRTITSHVSNVSREEFYKDNSDIVESYQWFATLDSSTCIQCGSLDGQIFPVGDGPRPTTDTHFGCRCTTVPIVKKEFSIAGAVNLDRPAVGADGAELDVSSKTTYQQWLPTQPASFQDEILGKDKGELFRSGLKLDKFVDENYKILTLKELEESDNRHIMRAFTKAFGD